MPSIIDNYSKDALNEIVKNSFSYVEVTRKLGFTTHPSSATVKNVKNRIEYYNISVEHFKHLAKTVRTPENIFINNSSAKQATVRKFFKKGEYKPYVCSICGLLPIWNDEPLTLILDHIDGNSKNCQLSNLRWVCPNCNQQLDTTGYKEMRAKMRPKVITHNYCLNCGKTIDKNATRCVTCSHILERKVERPSKENLEKEIYEYTFVELGKKYGISDNAIRKWCKAYNLPYKSFEIKKKK